MRIPPAVLVSISTILTRIRSPSGMTFIFSRPPLIIVMPRISHWVTVILRGIYPEAPVIVKDLFDTRVLLPRQTAWSTFLVDANLAVDHVLRQGAAFSCQAPPCPGHLFSPDGHGEMPCVSLP